MKNDNFWPYNFDIPQRVEQPTYSFTEKLPVELHSVEEGTPILQKNLKWERKGMKNILPFEDFQKDWKTPQGVTGNSGFSGTSGEQGKSGTSGNGLTGFGGKSIIPSFVTLSEQIKMLNKNAEETLRKLNDYYPGPLC